MGTGKNVFGIVGETVICTIVCMFSAVIFFVVFLTYAVKAYDYKGPEDVSMIWFHLIFGALYGICIWKSDAIVGSFGFRQGMILGLRMAPCICSLLVFWLIAPYVNGSLAAALWHLVSTLDIRDFDHIVTVMFTILYTFLPPIRVIQFIVSRAGLGAHRRKRDGQPGNSYYSAGKS